MLQSYCDETTNEMLTATTCSLPSVDSSAQLLTFYETPEMGSSIIKDVDSTLTRHCPETRQTLIRLAVEAIPNMTMPHCVGGPDQMSVQQRLQCFRTCLNAWQVAEPFMVTISRSINDGFTPKSVAEDLQVSVLEEIHERYCGCHHMNLQSLNEIGVWHNSACRLHVIFDYGVWEGSTFSN
jgi:hypothetical protein